MKGIYYRRCILIAAALTGAFVQLKAQQSESDSQVEDALYASAMQLSLSDFMQRVVEFNDSVQGKLLGFQAARHQRKAEMGSFEPAFVSSGEFVDRDQPNNFQAERSLGFLNSGDEGGYPSIFTERNSSVSSATKQCYKSDLIWLEGSDDKTIHHKVITYSLRTICKP